MTRRPDDDDTFALNAAWALMVLAIVTFAMGGHSLAFVFEALALLVAFVPAEPAR
jgi:hypothetical protein